MTTTTTLTPGTRATVTRTITNTWVGDIPAGTVVTIVEFEPEHVAPEDYAADLGDGRIVSFMADDLAAMTTTTAPTDRPDFGYEPWARAAVDRGIAPGVEAVRELLATIDTLRDRVSQLQHYVGTTANRLGIDNPGEIRTEAGLERVGEASLAEIERLRDLTS